MRRMITLGIVKVHLSGQRVVRAMDGLASRWSKKWLAYAVLFGASFRTDVEHARCGVLGTMCRLDSFLQPEGRLLVATYADPVAYGRRLEFVSVLGTITISGVDMLEHADFVAVLAQHAMVRQHTFEFVSTASDRRPVPRAVSRHFCAQRDFAPLCYNIYHVW